MPLLRTGDAVFVCGGGARLWESPVAGWGGYALACPGDMGLVLCQQEREPWWLYVLVGDSLGWLYDANVEEVHRDGELVMSRARNGDLEEVA